jgi:hypothetical protein
MTFEQAGAFGSNENFKPLANKGFGSSERKSLKDPKLALGEAGKARFVEEYLCFCPMEPAPDDKPEEKRQKELEADALKKWPDDKQKRFRELWVGDSLIKEFPDKFEALTDTHRAELKAWLEFPDPEKGARGRELAKKEALSWVAPEKDLDKKKLTKEEEAELFKLHEAQDTPMARAIKLYKFVEPRPADRRPEWRLYPNPDKFYDDGRAIRVKELNRQELTDEEKAKKGAYQAYKYNPRAWELFVRANWKDHPKPLSDEEKAELDAWKKFPNPRTKGSERGRELEMMRILKDPNWNEDRNAEMRRLVSWERNAPNR